MATYASNPTLALPEYTPEVNLGIYATGLQQKTQQYYAGIQKVQGVIDNIAGLELARDTDKQHLNSLFSGLQSKISNTVGSDFSSLSVVNSVAGMAGSIYRDPQIKNGVASTANIKALTTAQAELKEKHPDRYSAANEWFDNNQVSNYLQNTDPNARFSQTSPTPYINRDAEYIKILKEMNPNSTLQQGDFTIGDDGRISILKENAFEGFSTTQLRSAVSLLTSRPDIQRQFLIDGNYSYQNLDRNTLIRKIDNDLDNQEKTFISTIENEKARLASDVSLDQTVQTKRLSELEDYADEQLRRFRQIKDDSHSLSDDQIKTNLYKANWEANILGAYGYTKSSSKILDSPINKARLDREKFDFEILKENKNTSTSGINTQTVPSPFPISRVTEFGETSLNTAIEQDKQEYSQSLTNIINGEAINNSQPKPKIQNTDGSWRWNVGPLGYASQELAERASDNIYKNFSEKSIGGNATPETQTKWADLNSIKRRIDEKEYIKQKINSDPYINRAQTNLNRILPKNLEGLTINQVQIASDDLLDIYYSRNETGSVKEDAENRLKSKFGNIPVMGGSEATGTNPSLLNQAYNSFEERAKTIPELKNYAELIRDTYSQINTTRGDYASDFIVSKPEAQRDLTQRVRSVLNSVIVQESRLGRKASNAQKALELLGNEDIKSENITTGYTIDQNTGKAYLYVKEAGKPTNPDHMIEVPSSTLETIPGVTTQDRFKMKFGSSLQLSQYETTDLMNKKEDSAYEILPTPGNPYQIKYHLVADNPGESYNVKLYIRDTRISNTGRNENLLLNGINMTIPSGRGLTPDQILGAIERFKNPKEVEKEINYQRTKNGS